MTTSYKMLNSFFALFCLIFTSCSTAQQPVQSNKEITPKQVVQSRLIANFSIIKDKLVVNKGEKEICNSDKEDIIEAFKEHKLSIAGCDYHVTVFQKDLNIFYPETENKIIAYQYNIEFLNCPEVAEKAKMIGGGVQQFSPTILGNHKFPSTFYFLGDGTKIVAIGLYGMPDRHKQIDLQSVFEYE